MTDIDSEIELVVGNDVAPELRGLIRVLASLVGAEIVPLTGSLLDAASLRHWNRQPDTAHNNLRLSLFGIIDGRPEPSNQEAEAFVLALFRQLREFNSAMNTDPSLLGSTSGQCLLRFLEDIRAQIGTDAMWSVIRSTPGLLDRKMFDGLALLSEASIESCDGSEASMRGHVDKLSRSAELSWRPLLRAYLELTLRARKASIAPRKLQMLGQIHAACTNIWTNDPGPTVLLDTKLLAIRNAHSHPGHLAIDLDSGTISGAARPPFGPVTDVDLRSHAEQLVSRLFQAALALETVALADIFKRLDEHGWRLAGDPPLFAAGSTSAHQ